MIDFNTVTANEMRAILAPAEDDLLAAEMYLCTHGWKWMVADDPRHPGSFNWGWWIHPDHPAKCRPAGDAGHWMYTAWDTIKAYIAPERR